MNWFSKVDFLSLPSVLLLARIATPFFFLAHAIVRISSGTIGRFGAYMESLGFPNGVAVVWLITAVEIVASALILSGYAVRYAASALFVIVVGGIILIHRHIGWFVGEHGTGGSEYSVALIILLAVVASADAAIRQSRKDSIDTESAIE